MEICIKYMVKNNFEINNLYVWCIIIKLLLIGDVLIMLLLFKGLIINW